MAMGKGKVKINCIGMTRLLLSERPVGLKWGKR